MFWDHDFRIWTVISQHSSITLTKKELAHLVTFFRREISSSQNKLRGKIEYMPDNASYTIGAFGSLHHPLVFTSDFAVEYFGITVEPFIRWYGNQDAQGLYFQLKGFGGIWPMNTISGAMRVVTSFPLVQVRDLGINHGLEKMIMVFGCRVWS